MHRGYPRPNIVSLAEGNVDGGGQKEVIDELHYMIGTGANSSPYFKGLSEIDVLFLTW